jgi:lipopolysaccharide transport system permease protein
LSGNAAYLKKLPVPEHVFVAETVAAASITLAVSFFLFIFIAIALGLRPSWHWLLLPIPMFMLQAVGFGFGLIVGTLNVFFTDVAQILGIALQVLFWLTPIVYPSSKVSLSLRYAMRFNPATPGMDAIHDLFVWHTLPPMWTYLAMAAWAIGTIGLGSVMLNRLRGEIRDVL